MNHLTPQILLATLPDENLPGIVVDSDGQTCSLRLAFENPVLRTASEKLLFTARRSISFRPEDRVFFTRTLRDRDYLDNADITQASELIAHDVKPVTEEENRMCMQLIESLYSAGYYDRLMLWHEELAAREEHLNDRERDLDVQQGEQQCIEEDQAKKHRRLQEREKQLAARGSELDKRASALVKGTADVERYGQELENRELELITRENDLMEGLKVLESLEREIAPYRKFLPLNPRSVPRDSPPVSPIPQKLGIAWPALLREHEMALSPDTARVYLLSIMTSLVTGSLVLLDGPVGSGKTSIVTTSAMVLDAQAAIIPVRPGWLDPTDLLGYFDPLARLFRPTSFVDALVAADDDPNRIHLICLDELNLARIENYAADLLSALEYRGDTRSARDRRPHGALELYPRATFDGLFAEYELLGENDEANRAPHEEIRLTSLKSTLYKYPDRLNIPQNVVFLGTLNSDQTTYELSPKVIDRSFIVPFESAFESPSARYGEAADLDARLSSQALLNATSSADPDAKGWSKIEALDEQLKHIGIPLSYRVKRDYEIFIALGKAAGFSDDEILPLFAASKLLPRVGFTKGRQRAGSDLSADRKIMECRHLIDALSQYPYSDLVSSMLQQLTNQLDDPDVYDVGIWR